MAVVRTELRGSIQGRTVLLDDDPGLPDGAIVTVSLIQQPVSDEEKLAILRRLAGAWAADAEEIDRNLEWNRQQRKVDRREVDE